LDQKAQHPHEQIAKRQGNGGMAIACSCLQPQPRRKQAKLLGAC